MDAPDDEDAYPDVVFHQLTVEEVLALIDEEEADEDQQWMKDGDAYPGASPRD